jgi:hypothetical protein
VGWRNAIGNVAKSAGKVAEQAVDRAGAELQKRGLDGGALWCAAAEGLRLRNRKGEVRKWRVARALLTPASKGRALKSAGGEFVRQIRSTPRGVPVVVGPEAFDNGLFVGLIDWAVEAGGVPDEEEQRFRAAVRLASDGIDGYASQVLGPAELNSYEREIDEADIDLPPRAGALLRRRPDHAAGLLSNLEAVREELVRSGRETGSF